MTHYCETGSQKAAEFLRHWGDEFGDFLQDCANEMLDKLEHPISEEIVVMPAEQAVRSLSITSPESSRVRRASGFEGSAKRPVDVSPEERRPGGLALWPSREAG